MTPPNHEPYTDKYFLRTKQILQAEGLNPYVRAQVFIRKGPGVVAGIDEAVELLRTYSPLEQHGGRVYAKRDGDDYQPKETLMVIEAPVQDIVTLETMYLGVISAATTKANGGSDVDPEAVTRRMRDVVDAARGKPVIYFGARHWHYDQDAQLSAAAYDGGAIACSTDIGAATFGKRGIGTIPHALENIMAWRYGKERAVVEATKAFDKHIDTMVPRIALNDYNNQEVTDTINTYHALGRRLHGVRIDTCGENVAQGALTTWSSEAARELFGKEISIPQGEERFWAGTGVTVSGVYAVRKALDDARYQDCRITLSSGFGDPRKVRAFRRAEDILGMKLFDDLGVGGVYDSRMATMDIVAVGEDREHMLSMSKAGREYRPNDTLELVIGRAAQQPITMPAKPPSKPIVTIPMMEVAA
jgi:nicotinate phosphoribosyltransferase